MFLHTSATWHREVGWEMTGGHLGIRMPFRWVAGERVWVEVSSEYHAWPEEVGRISRWGNRWVGKDWWIGFRSRTMGYQDMRWIKGERGIIQCAVLWVQNILRSTQRWVPTGHHSQALWQKGCLGEAPGSHGHCFTRTSCHEAPWSISGVTRKHISVVERCIKQYTTFVLGRGLFIWNIWLFHTYSVTHTENRAHSGFGGKFWVHNDVRQAAYLKQINWNTLMNKKLLNAKKKKLICN